MSLTPDLKFLLMFLGCLALIGALIGLNHTPDIGAAVAAYSLFCTSVGLHDVASGHFDQTAPGATPPQTGTP